MSSRADVSPGITSLTVVGIGIQWAGQTTAAARCAIERADRVLYALADGWAAQWVESLNRHSETLPYPRDGRPRSDIYRAMAERIVAELEQGGRVCAVFYGSPAVLTKPAHLAIELARAAGFSASMLPGVSFLDCLFCDLGVDPARGCQIYEASDLLRRELRPDAGAPLIVCQVALAGNHGVFAADRTRAGVAALVKHLSRVYSPAHPVIVYEAASHPLAEPRMETVPLRELAHTELHEISTLYIRPVVQTVANEGERR
jgi:uncharacterized protein YabN with tetrapyrrole methylase and pyrophosphatase domain